MPNPSLHCLMHGRHGAQRKRVEVLVSAAAFGVALVVAAAAPAGAQTPPPADDCADLCTTSPTCVISNTRPIVPGTTIDCSALDLELGTNGKLEVNGGSFTLKARNLDLLGEGSMIMAYPDAAGRAGGLTVQVDEDFRLEGKLRANGDKGGGRINVSVGGNMVVTSQGTDGLEAIGTSTAGGGGQINVDVDGTLTIADPVSAYAGGASGNPLSGGRISLSAGGDIITSEQAHISASGRAGGAGSIEIVAGGDVLLGEHLSAEGLGSGASGGQVEVVAGDYLDVGFEISTRGGVNVGGSAASGGSVELSAGCGGVRIAAPIRATGGQLGDDDMDPGRIEVESRGNLTVLTGMVLETRALQTAGSGGTIVLSARDLIDLQGTATLDARGSTTAPGQGGDVQLESCRLSMANGSTIDVTAATGGAISLRATKEPPATNGSAPQPMTIASAAVLKAAGTSAPKNGRVELAPLLLKAGVCSNSGAECMLDTDCTVGCQAGECNYANPDTAGLNTQFDVVPERLLEADFGECQAVCE